MLHLTNLKWYDSCFGTKEDRSIDRSIDLCHIIAYLIYFYIAYTFYNIKSSHQGGLILVN